MFKTILVPLDGSELAEQALPLAGVLAQPAGASIVLVRAPNMEPAYATVESAYGLIYPEQAIGQAAAEAQNYLKSTQARQAARGVHARAVVAEGDAAGAIVDIAATVAADLIVMSSHGYTGLTRLLLGSVTEKVLRAATSPVLVVRSPRPFQHVLVTLDGSELAERAVAPAIDTALAFGAELTLLRVVPEIRADQLHELDQFEAGLGPRLGLEMREDAEAYLQTVVDKSAARGLHLNCAVRPGPAATTILEYAESHAVDLIAMATHGRGGLPRLVYGSVTEKVLHTDNCSTLIVRPRASNLN